MFAPLLRQLTAWVCLLVTFALGAVPARGLVLCLGPEGTVSVEVAPDGEHCGGCSEIATEAAPLDDEGRGDDLSSCPCTDIPVVTPVDTPGRLPRYLEANLLLSVTLQPALGARPILPVADWSTCLRVASPRCAPTLSHIRSVVLHV